MCVENNFSFSALIFLLYFNMKNHSNLFDLLVFNRSWIPITNPVGSWYIYFCEHCCIFVHMSTSKIGNFHCHQFSKKLQIYMIRLMYSHKVWIGLEQSFLIWGWQRRGGNFTLYGTFSNVWRHFLLSNLRRHYWLLVGSDQGCCWLSYNAQDNCLLFLQKNFILPKMSIIRRLGFILILI